MLFGIVISVFLLQAVQQYNPQEACRMLAKEMKDLSSSKGAFREIEAHLAVHP